MPVAKLRILLVTVLMMALLAACDNDDPVVDESPTPAETASPTATASPSPSAPASVSSFIPGLSAENVALLDACLAGDDAACDKAQEPERLNDSNFSSINQACTAGNQQACLLKQRLVEAELRLRSQCDQGVALACVTPLPGDK